MGKVVFELKNSEKMFSRVSLLCLLLNKLNNTFFQVKPFFSGETFKTLQYKILFAHFRVTVQMFGGLLQSEKAIDMKFWNWGPTTIWHIIESVAFFFKITPT